MQNKLPDDRPPLWWRYDYWHPHWREDEIPHWAKLEYQRLISRPRPAGAGYDYGQKVAPR